MKNSRRSGGGGALPFSIEDRNTKYAFDFIYNAMPASPLPERDTYEYRRESEI